MQGLGLLEYLIALALGIHEQLNLVPRHELLAGGVAQACLYNACQRPEERALRLDCRCPLARAIKLSSSNAAPAAVTLWLP